MLQQLDRNRRGRGALVIGRGKQLGVERRQLVDLGRRRIERQRSPARAWTSVPNRFPEGRIAPKPASSIAIVVLRACPAVLRELRRGRHDASTRRCRVACTAARRSRHRRSWRDRRRRRAALASFEIRSSRRTSTRIVGAAFKQQRIPPHHRIRLTRLRIGRVDTCRDARVVYRLTVGTRVRHDRLLALEQRHTARRMTATAIGRCGGYSARFSGRIQPLSNGPSPTAGTISTSRARVAAT